MARKPKKRVAAKSAPPANVEVKVSVPPATNLRIADLTKLNDEEVNDLLEKAKTSKVRFVILNAPFKVRPLAPAS